MALPHFQLSFKKDVEPFAQVTMLDADWGDSNIIDLHTPLGTSTTNASWFRSVVDSGPPNKGIVEAAYKVLSNLRTPAFDGNTGGHLPKVEEFILTHSDDDHIGNAAEFLDKIYRNQKDLISGCRIVHVAIPALYPPPPNVRVGSPSPYGDTYTIAGRTFKAKPGEKINVVDFEVNVSEASKETPSRTINGWANEVNLSAGFEVIVQTSFDETNQNWKWDTDGAEWIPETKKETWGQRIKLNLVYTDKFYNAKKTVSIKGLVDGLYLNEPSKPDAGKMVENWKWPAEPTEHTITGFIASFQMQEGVNRDKQLRFFRSTDKPDGYNEFTLDWADESDGSSTKKTKHSTRRREVNATEHVIETPTPLPNEGHSRPIRKFNKLSALHGTILSLNKEGGVALQETSPANEAIKLLKPNNGSVASRTILGPDPTVSHRVVRAAILGGYIVNEKADDFTFHELQLQVPGIDEDANRASIITMYEHRVPPLGGDHKPRARPSMLFTGDAFEFDFCESMMGRLSENIWNQKDEFVDILKVPHHGSAASESSLFYKRVRSSVYLISASPHGTGSNPRLSTLMAIIEGFRGKNKNLGDNPFYIFFSDPDIDRLDKKTRDETNDPDVLKKKENALAVRQILNSPLKPGPRGSDFYYEMWKLNDSDDPKIKSFGSILFGWMKTGNRLAVEFRKESDVKIGESKEGSWKPVLP